MDPIQSTINKLPLPQPLKALSFISPSPFVLSSETYVQFSDLHDALLHAIRSLLCQYPHNIALQKHLPVPPRIRQLFSSAPSTCSHIGSIRPELIFDNAGAIRLVAINASFPFSVALVTAVANMALHKATMITSCSLAEQELSCISSEMSFLPDLKAKLISYHSNVLWLITDDDAELNAKLFSTVLQIPFRVAHSTELLCQDNASNGLFVKKAEGQIFQVTSCVLQLTEEKLLSLEDSVLDAIAELSYSGHSLNDLRNIFLVSQPSFLETLCSDAYRLDNKLRQTLRRFILSKPSDPMKQRQFNSTTASNLINPVNKFIMLSSLDGEFYGPALCSSSSGTLTSFADGVLALPAMKLYQVPPSSRVWCDSLEEADIPIVLEVMRTHGLALVGVNERLGSPERLHAFVSKLGAKLRFHKGEAVWNITPSQKAGGNSCSTTAPSKRMFDVQTSLEFKLHTDCAFEEMPPEWLVLAIVRSDGKGGGMFSFANVRDHVSLLSEDQIQALLHIKPKVEAPPGFEGPDGSPLYTIGPVLLDRNKARFRYNNLNLEPLSEGKARKLSDAFNVLYKEMEKACEKYRMIVPQQTLLIMNNQEFVHARTAVRDPRHHLQRVRFDMPNLAV